MAINKYFRTENYNSLFNILKDAEKCDQFFKELNGCSYSFHQDAYAYVTWIVVFQSVKDMSSQKYKLLIPSSSSTEGLMRNGRCRTPISV